MLNVSSIEVSEVAATFVSLAYPEHLNCSRELGSCMLVIPGDVQIDTANTSIVMTYNRGDSGKPWRTLHKGRKEEEVQPLMTTADSMSV